MSEQTVVSALKTVGLTEKEAEVYVLIAKCATLGGLEISKRLKMHKAQVYTILKNLQRKGIVEATLESPMRFSAVPFEEILDSFVQTRRDQASSLEKEKNSLLADWERIQSGGLSSYVERFVTIQGRKRIQSRILDMVNRAKKELQMMVGPTDTLRVDRLQLIEEVLDTLTKRHSLRVLTNISKENLNTVKRVMKIGLNKHLDMEWRHLDIESSPLPRIIMKDREETLMLQTDEISRGGREEIGLWTNSRLIGDASIRLFEELWHSGIDVAEKIYEIENRKPMGKTTTIEDWRIAYRQFTERVRKARKEIVEIGPSIDVFRHQGKFTIQDLSKENVRIRAMFPLDVNSVKEAQKLSKWCEIRDPNVNYLGMALIDGEHLFQFNAQMQGANNIDPTMYFKNMFYTTDPAHITKMGEMLEGLWQRSARISDIESRLRGRR